MDILAKYRPFLAQLEVPFIVESGTAADELLEEFSVTRKSAEEIAATYGDAAQSQTAEP